MKYLIIHHTAVSRETQKAQFFPTNRYHKQKWNMVSKFGYYHGYTHFVGTNGAITQVRGLGEEGMHTIGHNKSGNIAVCLAGNFNVELPNIKQVESLRKLIRDNPDYQIAFHRDLQINRTCPGNLFTKDYLKNVILQEVVKEKNEKQYQISNLQKKLDYLRELLKSLLLN